MSIELERIVSTSVVLRETFTVGNRSERARNRFLFSGDVVTRYLSERPRPGRRAAAAKSPLIDGDGTRYKIDRWTRETAKEDPGCRKYRDRIKGGP